MFQPPFPEHLHLEKTFPPFPCSASRLDGLYVANIAEKTDLLGITGFHTANSSLFLPHVQITLN